MGEQYPNFPLDAEGIQSAMMLNYMDGLVEFGDANKFVIAIEVDSPQSAVFRLVPLAAYRRIMTRDGYRGKRYVGATPAGGWVRVMVHRDDCRPSYTFFYDPPRKRSIPLMQIPAWLA